MTAANLSRPVRCAALSLVCATAAMSSAADGQGGMIAELWPHESPAGESAKRSFEQWRAKDPGQPGKALSLEQLSIPARENSTMVRVRGVFTPPETCHYAFLIDGTRETKFASPDEAELWLQAPSNGGWKLAQRTDNPNKRSGRIALEAGVPVNFEFYTMGSRAVTLSWHSQEQDPVTGRELVKVPLAPLPSSALSLRAAKP